MKSLSGTRTARTTCSLSPRIRAVDLQYLITPPRILGERAGVRGKSTSTQTILNCVLLLLFAFLCPAAEAESPTSSISLEYDDPVELCKLKNKKINESSGLAISRRNPDLFWTHNDSGDKARLYCFNRKGKDLGTTKVKGSGAHDWEDMCSYMFNGHAKLLVGDIGDNGASRKYCKLYVMTEPEKPGDDVKRCQAIRLRYSTGSMDCESIAVDVERQKLLLVEKKRWVNCRVFEADFPLDPKTGELKTDKLERDKRDNVVLLTAEPIAQIDLPIVCAMDVSSDGRRAIVMTMGESFEFARGEKESWTEAFARKPRKIHMPARRQGESICYDAEGRDLFLTSELRPTPLFRVPVKE